MGTSVARDAKRNGSRPGTHDALRPLPEVMPSG
jgi:hypothetical protein